MSTKPKQNRPSGTVATLAKGLNLSPRRVAQLLGENMPATLPEARLWRREHTALPADYLAARARKMTAAAELAEIELAAKKGELVSRAEAEAEFRGIAYVLNAFARRLENEVPQICLGLPLDRSRPAVVALIREMMKALGDKESAFWKAHPQTIGK